MSNVTFPTFPGMKIEVTRTPQWSTKVHAGSSGTEQRVSFYSAPLYEFTLNIEFLRERFSGGAQTEASTLTAFFNARQGSLDSFLFTDPLDGTVRTVRFKEDRIDIERLANGLWSCKKLVLREVR